MLSYLIDNHQGYYYDGDERDHYQRERARRRPVASTVHKGGVLRKYFPPD